MTSPGKAPKLIALSGPAAGQVFDLFGEEIVIGRDTTNPIAIADPSLSRKHCLLLRTGEGWTIRDMGSVNGIVVNGERAAERLLSDADHIVIGKTELLVRLDHDHKPEHEPWMPDASATVNLNLADALYLQPATELPALARVQRDLQSLVRIGSVVAGIHEREALERQLLDAAFDIVPATAAAFVRVDPVEGNRQVVCTRQRTGASTAAPSSTVLDEALSKRLAILANNAAGDRQLRDAPSIAEAAVTSVLAVPLVDRQHAVGALYLTTTDPRTTFDQLHLEVMTALAGIGSAALGNVGRFERLTAEADQLKDELLAPLDMVGHSEVMERLYRMIKKVAPTDLSVLISGETGTGKELAARALHRNGKRAAWSFVAINCATLGEHLLESELFGHERGAFTGAIATKRGKFEIADRGTIFLDEVGELPLALQAKLLRVLQERELERVGGTRPIKVDVRVIAASNRDLKAAVAEKRFREDLYFRLNGFSMHMPPLRERREDIRTLAQHFAVRACRKADRPTVQFTPEAMQRLLAHDWPGNVREFENVIERAVALSSEAEILPEDLPEGLGQPPPTPDEGRSRFQAAIDDAKRRVVEAALAEAGGVVVEAARLLGLHPNYLHRLMTSLGMRPPGRSGSVGKGT